MNELIRGFVDGQISRRVFIRRLVSAGVALTGAVAYADLLQAQPAAALGTEFYLSVADYLFYPAKETLSGPGDYVHWTWSPSASGHSVTETSGVGLFDSSPTPTAFGWNWVTGFGHEFWASGTFPYRCKDDYHTIYLAAPMTGKIRVPVRLSDSSGRTGKPINVQFGTADLTPSPSGAPATSGAAALSPGGVWTYEVQVRKPDGSWKDWVVGGTAPTKDYTPKVEGRHGFRARLRRVGAGASGWSPVATFTAR